MNLPSLGEEGRCCGGLALVEPALRRRVAVGERSQLRSHTQSRCSHVRAEDGCSYGGRLFWNGGYGLWCIVPYDLADFRPRWTDFAGLVVPPFLVDQDV